MTDPQKPNRLAHETSPYLQQHATNPVDWFPWGEEALREASESGKPIFLSVGYSACHWCHVMERESFEDETTAEIMNRWFINIKVDREERPDLDQIYMAAVQMLTQHGGWPMSVFLTHELEPFYGGTYFPPEPRHGSPSFKQILEGVADAWNNRRDEAMQSASRLTRALQQMNFTEAGTMPLDPDRVDMTVQKLEEVFDPGFGGFGTAPKFPHAMDLKLCLRAWKRSGATLPLEIVQRSLDRMGQGGIYDHLGGGFHRYSTDERWLVPHFEKMLYDNALLCQLYIEGFQATGNQRYAQVARESLDYVIREMMNPDGGFYSTQDADSEGVEGKFFVWSLAEIEEIVADQAAVFAQVYDVSDSGNWEGTNILNLPRSLEQCAASLSMTVTELELVLSDCRSRLKEHRARRIAPARDDKIIVSWNGLMISAMAMGYQVLGDQRYLDTARNAALFIIAELWPASSDGQRGLLLHGYMDGTARLNAYLDDYANLIDGIVSLYESDFDALWIQVAVHLADIMVDQFWDEPGGSFYFTGKDHETLVTRPRDIHDGSTPSGNSMAVTALIRLGRIAGREDLVQIAERTLKTFSPHIGMSLSVSQMAIGLELLIGDPVELVVVAGDDPAETETALKMMRHKFIPNKVVLGGSDKARELAECFKDKLVGDGKVTVYLCRQFACQAPWEGLEAIEQGIVSL